MKKRSLKSLFILFQENYTSWENNLLSHLGFFGRYLKRRIDAKMRLPDWKRVQNLWIWISIFAFVCGTVISGFYYQAKCNEHIITSFYPEYACELGLECSIRDYHNPKFDLGFNESPKILGIKGG